MMRSTDHKEFMRRVGRYIKRHRKYQGLSQADLAMLAGVSTSYICRIEQGRYNASAYGIWQILKALRTK